MSIDNDKFLQTAIRLAVLTNADADNIRAKLPPGGNIIEVGKKLGLITDMQVGTILSSMYSQGTEKAGGLTVEGERCAYHSDRLATRTCHRCNNPLCPDCGLPEDGFIFCTEDCLDEYREERDAVFLSQREEAARKRNMVLIIAAAAALVLLIAGYITYSKVGKHLKLSKASELLTQAQQSKGQAKLSLLREALKLNPGLSQAALLIPEAYLEASDNPTAEAEARKLLEKQPTNAQLRKVLVKAVERQGRLEEALKMYEELRSQGAFTPVELREIGLNLYQTEQKNAALPYLEEAYKRQEQDRETALILGEYYMESENYDAALPYLEAVIDQTVKGNRGRETEFLNNPGTQAKALLMLAKAGGARHDTARLQSVTNALQMLRTRKLATEENLVAAYEVWLPIADTQALNQMDTALKQMATTGSVRGLTRVTGMLEGRKGNVAEAARLLEKSLLENPKDVTARQYLLDFYVSQARYGEARKHLDSLKELGEKGLVMDSSEAIVLTGEGRLEDALKIAEQVLAKSPDNPQVLGIAARIYMDTGRLAEAIKALNHLIGVAPSLWSYYQGMLFSLRLGDREKAMELARRADTALVTMPKDIAQRIKRITGLVTGDVDGAAFPETRVATLETRLLGKARNDLDLVNKAATATGLFSYITMPQSADNIAVRNAAYSKLLVNPYTGSSVTDAFLKKLSGPIADAFKDGFTRTMAFYETNLPSAAWRNEFTSLNTRFQAELSRAPEGCDKLAAMLKAMRDAGLLVYQANRNPAGNPGRPSASAAMLKSRYELEDACVDRNLSALLYARHALETLALAAISIENGNIAETALASILRDDAYQSAKADDGLEQLKVHMIYLSKAASLLNDISEATLLSGMLKQMTLSR
ncbi:MAG TPA: tetratricopeptide repeat protein [Planctomycetes bacterium]|nr:tetratricopeptide repeat protein [Planctomycetota bacterium]